MKRDVKDIRKDYLNERITALLQNISIDLETDVFYYWDIHFQSTREDDDDFLERLTEQDLEDLKQTIKYNRERNIHNVPNNDLEKYNEFIYDYLTGGYRYCEDPDSMIHNYKYFRADVFRQSIPYVNIRNIHLYRE